MTSVTFRIVAAASAAVIGFILLPASAIALDANASTDKLLSSCGYLKEATIAHSLRDLPPALREDILTRQPGLADRGEPFSAGCVTGTGEARERFIVAAGIGSRWAVAYEAGGFVHSAYVMAFDQQNERYEIVSDRSSDLREYCAEMNARLNKEALPDDGRDFLPSTKQREKK